MPTMAGAITIDGNWSDWFTSSLSAPTAAWWYNGGTGNAAPTETSAIAGHDTLLPTSVISGAGYALDYENHMTTGLNATFGEVYGGAEDYKDHVGNTMNVQAYDIEAVLALVQMNNDGTATLNLGIISGMTQNGQWVYDGYIYPGDVFVNFDGSTSNGYDHAVRIGTDSRAGQMNGGGVGTVFNQSMGTNNPDTFTTSRPYRVASTSAPTGTAAGRVGYARGRLRFASLRRDVVQPHLGGSHLVAPEWYRCALDRVPAAMTCSIRRSACFRVRRCRNPPRSPCWAWASWAPRFASGSMSRP